MDNLSSKVLGTTKKRQKEELDKVIQEMLDDGTIAKITEKWMFADMTQLIQE